MMIRTVSLLLALFYAGYVFSAPVEMLRNGQFPEDATGKPEKWFINAGTLELLPKAGRNGKGALRIVFAQNSWGYTLASTAQCAHNVHGDRRGELPGTPNAIYHFELWAKGKGRTNFVIALKAGRKHLKTVVSPYLLLNDTYRKLDFTMSIPEKEFTSFSVGVSAMRDSTVILDRVSVSFDPDENPNIDPGFDLPKTVDSQALKTPVFSMPFANQPPVVDGIISEEEYASGIGIERLFPYNKSSLLKVENLYRVSSDGHNLYLAMRSELSPDGSLVGLEKKPIGDENPLKNQDSLEFIIDPAPDVVEKREIFHGICNYSGPVYAKRYYGKNADDWTPGWIQKSKIDGKYWVMEVAIPLKDLKLNQNALKCGIGLRICRNWSNLRSGIPSSQLGVGGGAYIDPATMPRFTWNDNLPAVHHTALTGPDSSSPGLQLVIFNPGDQPVGAKVHLKLTPQFSGGTALDRNIKIEPGKKQNITLRSVGMPGEIIYGQINVRSQNNQPLYRRNFYFQLQRGKSEFLVKDDYSQAMRLAYSPTKNAVALEFYLSQMLGKNSETAKNIQLFLKNAASPEKVISKTQIPIQPKGRAWLDFWQLPPFDDGEYIVEAHVTPSTLKPLTAKFVRKTFPWQGNQIGKSPVLLPRFNALEQHETSVACVLRNYTFNSLGLPEQIIAAGQKLFTDPAVLSGKIDNTESVVEGIFFQWTKQSALEFQGKGKYKWGSHQGNFRVKMEFDGLVTWEFDLPDGMIDSLKLELPLRKEIATLYHAVGDTIHHHYDSGKLPYGNGIVWQAHRKPGSKDQGAFASYLWVGGELRGLAVCAESNRNYFNLPDTPAQKIVRSDESVKIIKQFISIPVKSQKGKTVSFQYQATPVKPMAADWRLKSYGFFEPAGKAHNYFLLMNGIAWGAETPCNDIKTRDEDMSYLDFLRQCNLAGKVDQSFLQKWNQGYQKMLDTAESPVDRRRLSQNFALWTGPLGAERIANLRPAHVLFYTNPRGMRFDHAESKIFMDEWCRTRFMDRDWKYGSGNEYILDPTESYRDYASWYFSKMQKHFKFHFYIDDVFPSSAESSLVTESWRLPDGTRHPAFGIRNMREWVKRATLISMENGIKEPFTLTHMTTTAIAPIIGMGYAQVGWEFFKMRCRPAQERFTREYIRAVNIGRQFGNVPFGLVTLTADGSKADWDWAKRTASGVALTHEIKLFTWYTTGQAQSNMRYQQTLAELMKFGYGQPGVDIYNYWDENYPVKIGNIDSSSILIAKKDAAILIVSDWKSGGNVSISLDSFLGFGKDFSAADLESGEEVAVKDGKLLFPLKKYDYKAILIRRTARQK